MKEKTLQSFSHDWKFLLGAPGSASDPQNAEREDYCDSTWKRVDLPHDWVIHQPFDKGEDGVWTKQGMQGYFFWENTGWYRKEFTLEEETAEKETYLYFGCAYRNAVIYVNGKKAGTHAYGYTSFELCITSFVRPGKNLVAIRLDHGAPVPDRWYSGAGLFRNVYLRQVKRLHFKTWGLGVKAILKEDGLAEVRVSAAIENTAFSEESSCLRLTIKDPKGRETASEKISFKSDAQSEINLTHNFYIKNSELWSDESPHLYRLEASIGDEGGDCIETKFGIRKIELMAHKGFFFNFMNVKLKGVCLHHDCGILGAAYYNEAWRRKLLILKGLGCNAIRTSHNPQAEEFLDLCDELGFYIIDECFDKWKSLSYENIFDDNWRQDLTGFIQRDRNHPSVFCWSVGNEVAGQGSEEMLKIAKMLCDYARTLDDRPVTLAQSPHVTEHEKRDLVGAPPEKHVEITSRIAQFVDVLALNYHEPWYPFYSKAINKPIIGTECYEYYSATLFSYEDYTAKNPWRYVLEDDNVLGQFIWAGMDYLGESQWPAKGWTGASLDICGFFKDEAWLRKALWSSEPVVHLCFYDNTQANNYARGRWNFPYTASHLNLDHLERRVAAAAVYTNCDEVELWINGKKIGRRKPADFANGIIEWHFDYSPGELKAVGFRGGKEAAVQEMKTAGPPAAIALNADRTQIAPYGIAHIEVDITDEAGIRNPTGSLLLGFSLQGDGEILGASSPDLNNPLGFDLPRVYTSLGKALVIIRAGASTGELCFSAYGENLKTGSACFTVG
jgi:beta-galactosidase